MSGVLERTMRILELLAQHGHGVELAFVADQLDIPRSAVHRLLTDLVRCGYVRQTREHGDYLLTTKLVALGFSFLSHSGVIDIAQPLLDRLAATSGELVRLAVADGPQLTWVARAQGARQGLHYDPDMGSTAPLACTSSGLAWLSVLPEAEALARVSEQGLAALGQYGPRAPTSLDEVRAALQAARERGYSLGLETYTAGLNAMAAPVRLAGQPPLGTLSIAGPAVRFTPERMAALGPELLACAGQLAAASGSSPFFSRLAADLRNGSSSRTQLTDPGP